ncbi:MAG: RimK/LysX family protein [Candidatus Saccharimonadales bacterium]
MPPKILFVFSYNKGDTKTTFGGFTKRLRRYGALEFAETDYVATEDLVYQIKDSGEAIVYDINSNKVLNDYAFAYFKGWESVPERAAALAIYLSANGTPYMDSLVGNFGLSKLSSMFRLWSNNIPIVPTVCTTTKNLAKMIADADIDYPVVIKSVSGQKGKDNILANNKKELLDFAEEDKTYLVQKYIKGDGDYRVGVFGGKVRYVIHRKGKDGSYLNNTSAGGDASLVDIDSLDPKLIADAEAAAVASNLEIVGVDIIVDSSTNQHYVLEVNQGSQIITGQFVDEKIKAFDDFIKTVINRRYNRLDNNSKLEVIGRHLTVQIPELGGDDLLAKTDTGAYRSSLRVKGIELVGDGDKQVLKFKVPIHESGHKKTEEFRQCQVDEFEVASVRNTSGKMEKRYMITTEIMVMGRPYETEITLANRDSMKYPLIIGRKLLRGHFMVNVELSGKDIL